MSSTKTFLRKSVRYAVMPDVIPRFKAFELRFGYLACLVAHLFVTARILPRLHPYIKSENINRFGMKDVFLEAYKNLSWSRKHIDQIVIFGLVCFGFLLLVGQAVLLGVGILTYAAPSFASGVTGFFVTTPPDYDIAFMMLDRVFGIPGLFESCVEQGIPCDPNRPAIFSAPIPWPMHDALHAMFSFYSRAMMLVGMFIILYYAVIVVIESAKTGIPFGERFASVYAPLRLVIAIILLLPLANGINSGQYLLLNVAKWGSSFGTNSWKIFNISLTNSLGAGTANMIIKPNAPDVKELVQFYHLMTSCKAIYQRVYGYDINPYLQNDSGAFTNPTTYVAAKTFYQDKHIRIKYGHQDAAKYNDYPGNLRPFCGEIILQVDSTENPYASDIAQVYFNLMTLLWNNVELNAMARKTAEMRYPQTGFVGAVACPGTSWPGGCVGVPPVDYLRTIISQAQTDLEANLETILDPTNLAGFLDLDYEALHLDRGWGAAGLWFNKIAQVNGAIVTAVYTKPYGKSMPQVMELVAEQKSKNFAGMALIDKYTPTLPRGIDGPDGTFFWEYGKDNQIAGYLAETHKVFTRDDIDPTPGGAKSTNTIGLILSTIFGADGLFDLRENNDVHPLAQMAGLGRSVIESAIQNIAIGATLAMGSGAASGIGDSSNAALLNGFSGAFITIGSIALTTGFLLYYILPFLPFIYFFFAVGKWVKGIFEAMVAVPLWALAHLKIDGDGVSGAAARNGYVLLFEVLIRPILTVFGLIAAITIFTALATMLNELFDLAAGNLSGYDTYASPGTYVSGTGTPTFFEVEYYRQGVDQFFFTLLYAVLIYVMATSCFKLIDVVPNSILRWIGEGVETFGDKAEDAADNLIRYAAIGGGMLGGQLTSAIGDSAKLAGQTAGGFATVMKH